MFQRKGCVVSVIGEVTKRETTYDSREGMLSTKQKNSLDCLLFCSLGVENGRRRRTPVRPPTSRFIQLTATNSCGQTWKDNIVRRMA